MKKKMLPLAVSAAAAVSMSASAQMYVDNGGLGELKGFALSMHTSGLSLGEMGVTGDRLDDLVEMALEDPSCGGNPVPLTAGNIRALFETCL